MLPLVSVPIAKPTHPAAVADEGPADDPLEPCVGSHGLFVCPPNQLSPAASSPVASGSSAGLAQHLQRWRQSNCCFERGRAPSSEAFTDDVFARDPVRAL
jgi:hypothetical protein